MFLSFLKLFLFPFHCLLLQKVSHEQSDPVHICQEIILLHSVGLILWKVGNRHLYGK